MFPIDSIVPEYYSHLVEVLSTRLESHVEFLCCNYYSDIDHCHYLMRWKKTNDEHHYLMDHVDGRRNDSTRHDIHSNDALIELIKFREGENEFWSYRRDLNVVREG